MKKFVHLHVHSEYSLLDGLSKFKKLIAYVKEKGMDAIAITDHGAMYGIIEFYKAATAESLKPILGLEGYMTNSDLSDREDRSKSQNYHITMLAQNMEGYKNLMKISSISHLEGYYYKPRFTKDVLKKYSEGLIILSGCPAAEVPQNLINGDYAKAKEVAEWFADIFGSNYYLEIQRHFFDKAAKNASNDQIRAMLKSLDSNEKAYVKGVVELSRDLGIPLVATNDSHYMKAADAEAQDALVCISTGKNVSDVKRLRYIDNPDFYIKTPDEMAEVFKDFPESIENTVKIAEKCDLTIPLGKWFFPKFPLPEEKTAEEYLEELVWERLPKKVENPSEEIIERVKYELSVINGKGYAPYFLIVMGMVNWANENGIITNTRGSAAGSLVSYTLGITTVNPIFYGLPFERFLNPFRPSPPDIDFDVSDSRRDEVIAYIAETYGHEKVAQICTFGRMLARGSVRDVARVLGFPYLTGDKVAKLVPMGSQGFPMTINRALEESKELKSLYDKDKDSKKIIELAKQIEGNARHISVHAAGVVVAPTDLTDFTPIQLEPSGDKVITQYEMHACEDVGLIKFDILGIRNLSILGNAIKIVKEQRGIEIKLGEIPLDDKKTFEMLARGETMGTFQLSGSGMTRFLKDLKPTRIEDLMVMVALYRPGPMSVIPEYIERKNNPKKVKYLDPRMEKFLNKSYGLIVYQDDLLFCAIELAGYTWEEADKFRKAVGKKIPAEMAAQKEKLMNGIVANGQTKEFAEMLWKLFEPFQAYGFNKAHAASYGMVAYQTAYMKANFPVEYMTALLTAESGDSEKISTGVNECRRIGIKVLGPDINESVEGFSIVADDDSLDKKSIRFGLNAIKNVGKAAIDAIITARETGKFLTMFDFLKRIDQRKVNKKVLESLIKVGALGNFGSRLTLNKELEEYRSRVVKTGDKNQPALFGDDAMEVAQVITDINLFAEEYEQNELEKFERELMGFSLSERPVHELISAIEHLATHKIMDIENPGMITAKEVTVAVVLSDIRIVMTKTSGREMAFIKAKDDTGVVDLIVFPNLFETIKDELFADKVFLVSGKLDNRDETNSVIVDRLKPSKSIDPSTVAESPEKKGEYLINVPSSTTSEDLKQLKTVLEKYPGESKVSLFFEGNKNKLDLPMKVRWSQEISKDIRDLFEKKHVLN